MSTQRPACDLCHVRKVKCDREDPCTNCVDAQVECRRTRPTRAVGSKVSRISALADRLSRLEQSAAILSQAEGSPLPSRLGSVADESRSPASSDRDVDVRRVLEHAPSDGPGHREWSYAKKRKYDQTEETSPVTEAAAPDGSHQAYQAREFLRRELDCNEDLSRDRRTVLESALKLIDQVSSTSFTHAQGDLDDAVGADEDITLQPFPPELFYMMSMVPAEEGAPSRRFYWPDHISPKTLENMCLALMEGESNEQLRTQYQVCVYAKAIAFIFRLPQNQFSERFQNHLRKSKKQYEAAAMAALNRLSFSATPSLSLLQALLSGALLTQLRGNMSRSWAFTAYASRVLVSLYYHTVEHTSPRSEMEQEIHASIYTCYYLDKLLSMLLLRPPSLPPLRVQPARMVQLDSSLPMTAILKTLIEFAQVQERALDILIKPNRADARHQADLINELVQDMYNVRVKFQEQRIHTSSDLEYEWIAVDFSYYAILTTILRSNPFVLKGPLVREECLSCARKALSSLKILQETLINQHRFVDAYPYFLTWTMLLYPLSPFFVLFCNVVGTSNPEDSSLIHDVTQALSRFVESNPLIAKLYRLFSAFLALCRPLMRRNSISGLQVQPDPQLATPLMPPTPVHVNDFSDPSNRQVLDYADLHVSGPVQSAWDDNLLWELFYNQPSLGWVESEIPDGLYAV